jgi:uncharacterized protein (UPF0261 family)
MEEILGHEKVAAMIDLSLHEVADHLFGGGGGDYDAGPERGLAAIRKGIPTVLVPGNIDFLVTGPLEVARLRFPGRPYFATRLIDRLAQNVSIQQLPRHINTPEFASFIVERLKCLTGNPCNLT